MLHPIATTNLVGKFARKILRPLSWFYPWLIVLVAPGWAVTISTSTTQTGGNFNNTGGGVLFITHATNNPLLTLAAGATTTNVKSVVVGSLNNEEGRLRIEGGSTLLHPTGGDNNSPLGTFGSVAVREYEGILGLNTGSTGTAIVTGAGSKWAHDQLYVGYGGTGDLAVEAGGQVLADSGIDIAKNAGSSGTATITGTGSLLETYNVITVGEFGTGVLNVENGATLHSGSAVLGLQANSSGTINLSGAGTVWKHPSNAFGIGLLVGGFGSGEINIEAGATVTSTVVVVGSGGTSEGTINISGVGSKLDIVNRTNHYQFVPAQDICDETGCHTVPGHWIPGPGSSAIGESGSGKMVVSDGGVVTVGLEGADPALVGDMYIGPFADSFGELIVTGAGSTFSNMHNIYMGAAGTGIATISNGGTLRVGDLLQLGAGATLNLQAGGTLMVRDFDFAAGTFNFTGGTLTATGNVTGDVIIPNGAMVTGTGDFENLVISDGGAVSPGASPEEMTALNSEWAAGGKYIWEINALSSAGGTAGDATGWDLLSVSGSLTISALPSDPFFIELHSLDSSDAAGLLAGFDSSTSSSWLIATAANGAFSSLNLASLEVDDTFFANNLAGGSFSLFAQNGGTELFLAFTPQSISDSPIVPEPATGILLLLGSILLHAHRSLRRR